MESNSNYEVQISVIVPMYNAEKYMRVCLKQLLSQAFQSYEVIVVDDGSKDNSLEICRDVAKNNPRLRVFHQENQGSGAARNRGVAEARGKYVFFPDADDVTLPHALSRMFEVAEEKNTDLLVFGFKTFASRHRLLSVKSFPQAAYTGEYVRAHYEEFGRSNHDIMGAPWNKLYRMQIIRENNIEFPTLRRHQDEVFISRYVAHVNDVYFIPDILFLHYANGLSLRYLKFPLNYLEVATNLHKFRKEIPLSWNPDSLSMRKYFASEYYVNTINSLELLFNPKWGFTKEQIKERMALASATFFANVVMTDFGDYDYMRYDESFYNRFKACAPDDLEFMYNKISRTLKSDSFKDRIKDVLAFFGLNVRMMRLKYEEKKKNKNHDKQ